MYCIHLNPGISILQVGAKAANLGKALSVGIRVPPGFVVTRDALTLFLNETGLRSQVCELMEKSNYDRTIRKKGYEELCADIVRMPVPEALREEVERFALPLLQSTPAGMAVRSSGIYEDSEKASFAGVYESFLSVNSIEELWSSIKRCWCSSWAPPAIDYSRKIGIEVQKATHDFVLAQPDQMAVLVQEMVSADAAGVIFTADPNTGDPWHFVLSSTFGLAQDVMNSVAPADSFVLEWDTSKIISRRIIEKPTMLVPGKSGLERMQLADEIRKAASLSDSMAQRIAEMALALDRLFNVRVDIEWAVVGEDIHLIQVRPITALPEFFPVELSEEDAQLHWRYQGNEDSEPGREIPFDPFFRDFWTCEQCSHYNYYRQGDVVLGHIECRDLEIHGYQFGLGWEWYSCPLGGSSFEKWLDEDEPKLRAAWLTAKRKMRESADHVAEVTESTRSAAEIIPHLLEMREYEWHAQATIFGPSQTMHSECQDLLCRFLSGIAPRFSADGLLQGLMSYSHERAQAAYQLGQLIEEDFVRDAFAQRVLDEIIPHLLDNHRECNFLMDYEQLCRRFGLKPPSWFKRHKKWSMELWDITGQCLPIMKNALFGRGRNPEEAFREALRRREANEQEIRHIFNEKVPSHLGQLNKLIDWAQFWTAALDDRMWSVVPYVSLYELLFQTGVRLQKEGIVDAPEDVFLFTVEDFERMLESKDPRRQRELYMQCKREYEMDCRLRPPEFIGAPPEPSEDEDSVPEKASSVSVQTPKQEKVFRGRGHTSGQVIGMSRKAENVADPELVDSLNDEDILVCLGGVNTHTDWLSLLLLVKGLVIDQDCRYLHHSGNISRECGVPMISLEHEEAVCIPDNTRIALDGKEGTVTVLDSPS